jgi:hypothetical protein
MSKLLITTQVYENYGGNDYVVKNFKKFSIVTDVVMSVRDQIECDGEYFRENIIGWEVVADDYLTDFERSQLEYEGRIMFPAKELEFEYA